MTPEGKSLVRSLAATRRWQRELGAPKEKVGDFIGKLEILEIIGRSFRLKCVCGKEFTKVCSLVYDSYRSCGCLHADLVTGDLNARGNLQHGWSETPEHNTWMSIKARCADLGNKKYGGRGIKVCDRWKESFENFLADMGPRPGAEYSIERRKNSGNYEPGNCKWATKDEQARNKRTSVFLEFNGRRQNMIDWCRELNIPPPVMHRRIKIGMNIEEVLRPNKSRAKRKLDIPAWQKMGPIIL
jgi:hypothetical protein